MVDDNFEKKADAKAKADVGKKIGHADAEKTKASHRK